MRERMQGAGVAPQPLAPHRRLRVRKRVRRCHVLLGVLITSRLIVSSCALLNIADFDLGFNQTAVSEAPLVRIASVEIWLDEREQPITFVIDAIRDELTGEGEELESDASDIAKRLCVVEALSRGACAALVASATDVRAHVVTRARAAARFGGDRQSDGYEEELDSVRVAFELGGVRHALLLGIGHRVDVVASLVCARLASLPLRECAALRARLYDAIGLPSKPLVFQVRGVRGDRGGPRSSPITAQNCPIRTPPRRSARIRQARAPSASSRATSWARRTASTGTRGA